MESDATLEMEEMSPEQETTPREMEEMPPETEETPPLAVAEAPPAVASTEAATPLVAVAAAASTMEAATVEATTAMDATLLVAMALPEDVEMEVDVEETHSPLSHPPAPDLIHTHRVPTGWRPTLKETLPPVLSQASARPPNWL